MTNEPTSISADVQARLEAPSAVRYIKLGKGGAWAREAIETGTLPLWYRAMDHAPCAAGDWDQVRQQAVAMGRKAGKITDTVRELKDYYLLDDRCLWVMIADDHLWWAFADSDVVPTADAEEGRPSRYRQTLDGWHCHDLHGEALQVSRLRSFLTKMTSYQGTICKVAEEDYLLRKIRGEEEPLVAEADALREQMTDVAEKMIRQLDWRDFEVLVDLILTRGGWQRRSALGKHEIGFDLLLDQPTTGETAWVQVKSAASQAVLDENLEHYLRAGIADRFFFACHQPKGELALSEDATTHIWTGRILATRAVASGLFDWLVDRVR